jgi:hypothetical protein
MIPLHSTLVPVKHSRGQLVVRVSKHIRLHDEQISSDALCAEPTAVHFGMNIFNNYTDSSIRGRL